MLAWLNVRNLFVVPTCAALVALKHVGGDTASTNPSAGVIAGACAGVAFGLVAISALVGMAWQRRRRWQMGKTVRMPMGKTVQMVPPMQSRNPNKKPPVTPAIHLPPQNLGTLMSSKRQMEKTVRMSMGKTVQMVPPVQSRNPNKKPPVPAIQFPPKNLGTLMSPRY